MRRHRKNRLSMHRGDGLMTPRAGESRHRRGTDIEQSGGHDQMRATSLLGSLLLAIAAAVPAAHAQTGASPAGALKLGVLTDMSGVYSDFSGNGSVVAVQMAIDDFGGKVLEKSE